MLLPERTASRSSRSLMETCVFAAIFKYVLQKHQKECEYQMDTLILNPSTAVRRFWLDSSESTLLVRMMGVKCVAVEVKASGSWASPLLE